MDFAFTDVLREVRHRIAPHDVPGSVVTLGNCSPWRTGARVRLREVIDKHSARMGMHRLFFARLDVVVNNPHMVVVENYLVHLGSKFGGILKQGHSQWVGKGE